MAEKARLKCDRTGPGMFSDECSVEVSRLDGGKESFVVPAHAVKDNLLEVDVQENGAASLATIPTEQPTVIPVDSAAILR